MCHCEVLIHFLTAGLAANSSSGAASLSLKAKPSVPSGSPPALGSSAAASTPPALGVSSSHSDPHPAGTGDSSAPSAAPFSLSASGTTGGCGTSGLPGPGSSAAANSSNTAPLTGAGTAKAATGTSHSGASSASAAQTAGASGHDATSAPPAFPHGIRPGQLCSPRGESTAQELEQFKAKKSTPGKVPQKPALADLLRGLPCNVM